MRIRWSWIFGMGNFNIFREKKWCWEIETQTLNPDESKFLVSNSIKLFFYFQTSAKKLDRRMLFKNNLEIGLYLGLNTILNSGQWLDLISTWIAINSTCALPRLRVTGVRTINFMTWLCLGLGLDHVLFASSTNVESGPRFAKICWFSDIIATF